MIERLDELLILTKMILLLAFLWMGSGCVDSDSQTLEWETVKAQIRAQFPSVAQLSTQELAEWLSRGKEQWPLILDARAPEEYAVSHLPGAILTPTEEEAREKLRNVDQTRTIVVYCSVGYRSSLLAERLGELGYKNVFSLEGSIFQWANEGRSLFRGTEKVRAVHPYDDQWGELLSRELWSYEPGGGLRVDRETDLSFCRDSGTWCYT